MIVLPRSRNVIRRLRVTDRVLASAITLERVQLPARHRGHLREIGRELEGSKDCLDLGHRLGGQAARVVAEGVSAHGAKPLDQHGRSYALSVRTSSSRYPRRGLGGEASDSLEDRLRAAKRPKRRFRRLVRTPSATTATSRLNQSSRIRHLSSLQQSALTTSLEEKVAGSISRSNQ